jgi:hypothetical protein
MLAAGPTTSVKAATPSTANAVKKRFIAFLLPCPRNRSVYHLCAVEE